MLNNVKKSPSGITLIALVITIIILLILAGVSISMVIGENGIATKAKKSNEETEKAKLEEAENLENLENEIENYVDGEKLIDFEEIKLAVLKEKEIYLEFAQELGQDNTNLDIGIGTDGNVVNLDLWTYRTISNSYISLNDVNANGVSQAAYDNSNIVDGKIQGTVPQYIYVYSLDKFLPVTNLDGTFEGCTNLEIAPELPTTATSMNRTFRICTNLTKASRIPDEVTNIYATFDECKKLKESPEIPEKITSLEWTFDGCIALEKCVIPENITDISSSTFANNGKLHLYFEHTEQLPTFATSFPKWYGQNSEGLIVHLKNSEMAEAFSAQYSSITVSDNYNW